MKEKSTTRESFSRKIPPKVVLGLIERQYYSGSTSLVRINKVSNDPVMPGGHSSLPWMLLTIILKEYRSNTGGTHAAKHQAAHHRR